MKQACFFSFHHAVGTERSDLDIVPNGETTSRQILLKVRWEVHLERTSQLDNDWYRFIGVNIVRRIRQRIFYFRALSIFLYQFKVIEGNEGV